MDENQKKMIAYWFDGAEEAWQSAQALLTSKRYLHSLFFCHLTLEKALKARFIGVKGEAPPPVHDLIWLAGQSQLLLSEDEERQLAHISKFNISGRYEDYRLQLHKQTTPEFAKQWLKRTESLYLKFRQD